MPSPSYGTELLAEPMTTASSVGAELRDLYLEQSSRIQQEFSTSGDGLKAVKSRTALVEEVIRGLSKDILGSEESGPEKLSLIATGGFGRGTLFPHSDVDVLFLFADSATEEAYRERIRRFSQEIW